MSISYDNYDIYVAEIPSIQKEYDLVREKLSEHRRQADAWADTLGFKCVTMSRGGRVSGIATKEPIDRPWLRPVEIDASSGMFGYEIPARIGRKTNREGLPYREAMLKLPIWNGSSELMNAVGFKGCRSWVVEDNRLYREEAWEQDGRIFVMIPHYKGDKKSKEELEHPAFRRLTKKEAFAMIEED